MHSHAPPAPRRRWRVTKAAHFAFILAHGHAHRVARNGIYPRRAGARSPQSRHDRKARASLEIARLCASVEDVALFGRRAISLVDPMGLNIPAMLEPGWQALLVCALPPAVD